VIRRGRFRELVGAQLALFEQEHADLLEAARSAAAAYDAADRDEAPERYERYADLLETAADGLAEMRDTYARTLDEDAADAYSAVFDRAVARRFPQIAPHLS
jgi:hypothetical protein